MKLVFIINPAAGKSNPMNICGEKIKQLCSERGVDYEIVQTERTGHATELAARFADEATAESPVRIFSVGGDGTLCEVANGMMGKPHCELGVIPYGSGNDFIRSFGAKEDFTDLEGYIFSETVSVDGIKTTCDCTELNSLNIASLGFDANVCNTANELKAKNKKLSGSAAYSKAIGINFFRKLYNKLTVTTDSGETFKGKYFFSVAANGQYYGGGVKGAPMADPTDGEMELILIKKASRLKFLTMVSDYTKGTYPQKRKFKRLLVHRQCKRIHVKSERLAIVNVDGECFPCKEVIFELMPSVIRLVVPQAYLDKKKTAETETA